MIHDNTNSSFPDPHERPLTRSVLIPRWCGFCVSGPLLALSVAMEGLHGLAAAVHFFFTRKRQREKFAAIVLGKGGRVAASLFLGISALLFSSGCTTFPGASFDDQVKQLKWSIVTISHHEASMGELLDDVHSVFIGDTSTRRLEETFEQLGW